jgi:endo-1,4-beta-xylanase
MVQLITALKDKGLVDGMGMQSHISMDSPVLSAYEAAIREYCKTGLEVHITELDMWLTRNDDYSFLKQAERYAELSGLYKKLRDEGLPITNVTVWGVIDNLSWLNAEGPNYPLLFDKYYMPKPAFWGFIGS